MVLRRIFGPKRDGVTGKAWRKLHNEEHRNFYSPSNIIRNMESRRMSVRAWETNRGEGNGYMLLVGKP
jgi:hypothetical protein